jgi:hypothetical protein
MRLLPRRPGPVPERPLPYAAVGYNPFRKRVKRQSDIVFVGLALVVVALLVVWALLPR